MVDHGRHHDHASYHGDRTVEAITKFAYTMLPEEQANPAMDEAAAAAAEAPPVVVKPVGDHVKAVNGPGCSITGFVLVKKVPGHLWAGAYTRPLFSSS